MCIQYIPNAHPSRLLDYCLLKKLQQVRMRKQREAIRTLPTCSKFTEGMFGVPCDFLQLGKPPGIIHQVLLMFRIHSIYLTILTVLIKQRSLEKLRKPVGRNIDVNIITKITESSHPT